MHRTYKLVNGSPVVPYEFPPAREAALLESTDPRRLRKVGQDTRVGNASRTLRQILIRFKRAGSEI